MVGSFNSVLANHYFNLQEDIFSSWGLNFTKPSFLFFKKIKYQDGFFISELILK